MQASVDFFLPAGDLNGDNVINTLDYVIFRNAWMSTDPSPDLIGDGSVGTADYELLKANWYTAGAPE